LLYIIYKSGAGGPHVSFRRRVTHPSEESAERPQQSSGDRKALSSGQITKRDLFRRGIFTTTGALALKNGLSPFARSVYADIPTGTPRSPLFGAPRDGSEMARAGARDVRRAGSHTGLGVHRTSRGKRPGRTGPARRHPATPTVWQCAQIFVNTRDHAWPARSATLRRCVPCTIRSRRLAAKFAGVRMHHKH